MADKKNCGTCKHFGERTPDTLDPSSDVGRCRRDPLPRGIHPRDWLDPEVAECKGKKWEALHHG